MLLNKDEVIDKYIFGTEKNSIHFEESIGDFVVLTKSNKTINYSNNTYQFKAGLTDSEMYIPLIVKEKHKNKIKYL